MLYMLQQLNGFVRVGILGFASFTSGAGIAPRFEGICDARNPYIPLYRY